MIPLCDSPDAQTQELALAVASVLAQVSLGSDAEGRRTLSPRGPAPRWMRHVGRPLQGESRRPRADSAKTLGSSDTRTERFAGARHAVVVLIVGSG